MDPTCLLCLTQFESIIHALRDCRIVKNFWAQLEAEEVNTSLFSGNLQQWVSINGRDERRKHKDHPHGELHSFLQSGAYGSIGIKLYFITSPYIKTWVMKYLEKPWSMNTM